MRKTTLTKLHQSLGEPATLSLKPRYYCPVCKEPLWTERSQRTRWQEWLFAKGWKRHYKTRCNLMLPEA